MKKLIALFLVLALAFGMTGCSKLKTEVETLNTKVAELEQAVADKTAELEAAATEKASALEAAAAEKASALEAAAAEKASALEAAAAETAAAVETAVAEKVAELEATAATVKAETDATIESLNAELADRDSTLLELTEKVGLKDVVVLYTNDVHCGVTDNLGYDSVVSAKEALENAGHTVILADVGDALQGDAIGTLSKGEYIIDIMNAIGYNVATIGNHEFDYGMAQFKSLAERANFPYVCCNFVDADGNPVMDSYTIIEANGWKIAFVGIATPKTLTTSTPTYFMDENGEYIYSFCQDSTGEKLYQAVQTAVDSARAEGADIVIALSHLGTEADCAPWTSPEVIAHTTGIDVFLDAHSHDVIESDVLTNAEGKSVLLTSTGTKLANIGCLTIGFDGALKTSLINDQGADTIINDTIAKYADLVNEVVAHTDVDLCTKDPATGERMVRTQETNLGDLCADGYQAMTGADIAIINGGGVRADIPAGDITYGQIIAVHPFGNMLCMIECTGEEIWQALELSASKLPAESGGFLHVSKNVHYTIDLNIPTPVVLDDAGLFVKLEGEHRVTSVTINGEPLDPEKTYTLACHDYKLKNMGDGYSMFKDNNFLLDSTMLDNQILINYIVDTMGGTVGEEYANPYGEGRITIIPVAEAAAEEPVAEVAAEEPVAEAAAEEPVAEAAAEEPVAEAAAEQPAA